jgi:hypothetical protein
MPPSLKKLRRHVCWTEAIHQIVVQRSAEDGVSGSEFLVSLILAEHRRREEALKQPNGAGEEKDVKS